MKSIATNSNLTRAKMQDDFEASSSIVLIEDDVCESKDFKDSRHITKWTIYEGFLERTLFYFNIEEMQYEFYFKDYDSMATIIGLNNATM